MPRESLNVYMTATDKMSPALASIGDKTKALDKETQQLQDTFNALQKANMTLIEKKTELQKKLREVNAEVRDARKSFNALHDEASSDALNKAVEKQQALKDEIAGTTKALQENQKMYKENIETIRKGGLAEESSLGSIAKGLAGGQLGQILASSLGGLGESLLTSAMGTPEASLISDTLSSTISGAAAGMIAGPVGAAIGAGVGALTGLISGGTKIFEGKDDAFKTYYGGLYEDVSALSGEMVASGSTIAGGREQTRMAFARRFGGEDLADEYLAQVEKMAANTNYDYDEIVGYAKLLLNSYEADDVLGVLQTLSDATAGLDLSSSDVNMMISGLSRMRTTGKATQEYLNYFRERGIDTDQALADSLGVDKSAVAGLVAKGKVGGEEAAQAILDFIQQEFGGLSDDLADTYDAMVDNLGDITASLQASGGGAYNTLRKEGVEAEMNALGGELGDAIKEINAVMGENQARRENLQEQYLRETLEAVLLGKEGTVFNESERAELAQLSAQYQELKARYDGGDTDAGAELESLYEQAQALGKAYFENSAEVERLNDIEERQIEAIRDAIAPLETAHQRLYELNQTLSKGLAATFRVEAESGQLGATLSETGGGGIAGPSDANVDYLDSNGIWHHAFGLERVPYDEYPALLHQDERVLTAAEARAQDAGTGGAAPIQLTVTGNDFVGTGEEMADQLMAIIMRKLEQAAIAREPK